MQAGTLNRLKQLGGGMFGEVDLVDHAQSIGAAIIFIAAVLTALGVVYKKIKSGLHALRQRFAEQISDVVFEHPSFRRIEENSDAMMEKVGVVERELTYNGGSSIKDKVDATNDIVSSLSMRLGNVEQQVENLIINDKEGDRESDHPPVSEFGP